ncbi:MAG: hypothetical protein U1D30_06560 [Planctomycetota bacterium]
MKNSASPAPAYSQTTGGYLVEKAIDGGNIDGTNGWAVDGNAKLTKTARPTSRCHPPLRLRRRYTPSHQVEA